MTQMYRYWCFTAFQTADFDAATQFEQAQLVYLMCQLERTRAGKLHVQGVMVLRQPLQFEQVRLLLPSGSHIEPTKDLAASIKYCSKE